MPLRTEFEASLVITLDELLATELEELGWLIEAELTEPKKELGRVEDTLESEGLMLDDEIDAELEAVAEVKPDKLEIVLDIELERPDGELDSIVQDTLDELADILDTGLRRPDDEPDAEFDMVKDEELERPLEIALDNTDDALETEADGLLKVVLESAKGELEIEFG